MREAGFGTLASGGRIKSPVSEQNGVSTAWIRLNVLVHSSYFKVFAIANIYLEKVSLGGERFPRIAYFWCQFPRPRIRKPRAHFLPNDLRIETKFWTCIRKHVDLRAWRPEIRGTARVWNY